MLAKQSVLVKGGAGGEGEPLGYSREMVLRIAIARLSLRKRSVVIGPGHGEARFDNYDGTAGSPTSRGK
jgi:hypothetical protein